MEVVEHEHTDEYNQTFDVSTLDINLILQRERLIHNLLHEHPHPLVAVVPELYWLQADCAASELMHERSVQRIICVVQYYDGFGNHICSKDAKSQRVRI